MSLLDDANNRIKQERLSEQEAERLRMRSFQPVDYTHYTVPVDNQVQALLTEFVQFMRSQGIAPIPCVMANCERIYKSGFFGETFVEIIHLFPSGFSAWVLESTHQGSEGIRSYPSGLYSNWGDAITESSILVYAVKFIKPPPWRSREKTRRSFMLQLFPGVKAGKNDLYKEVEHRISVDTTAVAGLSDMLILYSENSFGMGGPSYMKEAVNPETTRYSMDEGFGENRTTRRFSVKEALVDKVVRLRRPLGPS